jgi:predicted  nucleic acid-binding Zn-ribbon protein
MQSQASLVATPRSEAQHLPVSADNARPDLIQIRAADQAKDRPHATFDSLPPIIPPSEMKRTPYYESSSAHSPHPSSGSSMFGPAQSPMQSHTIGRSLPSPPNHHYAPTQYETHPQSAQTSHLQDLQHQISTKTLALQTLQREHDQLLAAFSRSQIRCSTLDKKSQVSDHEINSLTEEKIRLQQQVEALESQVEDLSQARDSVQKQSSADGAQWRQIMAMSSQLQVKGAEDARRHKAEKEAWDRQRDLLEERIKDLETGRPSGPKEGSQHGEAESSTGTDSLQTASMEQLRLEIVGLRQRCTDLETTLREVTGQTQDVEKAVRAMASIRARLASQIKDDDMA